LQVGFEKRVAEGNNEEGDGLGGGHDDGPAMAVVDGLGIIQNEAIVDAGADEACGDVGIGVVGDGAGEGELGAGVGIGLELGEGGGEVLVCCVVEEHGLTDVLQVFGAGVGEGVGIGVEARRRGLGGGDVGLFFGRRSLAACREEAGCQDKVLGMVGSRHESGHCVLESSWLEVPFPGP
jgi:hypothetical protein